MTLYHARPPPPVRNVPFAGGLHDGVPCYKSMKLLHQVQSRFDRVFRRRWTHHRAACLQLSHQECSRTGLAAGRVDDGQRPRHARLHLRADQAAAAEESGTRNQLSAADGARVFGDHHLQQHAQDLSQLLVSRGDAEPDQSGGPRRRLGDGYHPLFRRPSRRQEVCGRARHAGWAAALSGETDQRVGPVAWNATARPTSRRRR